MNAKTRMLMMLAAVVLILGLFSLEESTSAQSPNQCMKVKGKVFETFTNGGNTNMGTVTNGGILEGTMERVFISAPVPTSDPTTFSLTIDFSVTTNRGVLKTHGVAILDIASSVAAAIHRIDPNASTGVFAGTTGILYENIKVNFQSLTADSGITGEICFANN